MTFNVKDVCHSRVGWRQWAYHCQSLSAPLWANIPQLRYIVNNMESVSVWNLFRDLVDGGCCNHAASVAAKARHQARLCRRKMLNPQPKVMMQIFKFYVLPTTLNASQLWTPCRRYDVNTHNSV